MTISKFSCWGLLALTLKWLNSGDSSQPQTVCTALGLPSSLCVSWWGSLLGEWAPGLFFEEFYSGARDLNSHCGTHSAWLALSNLSSRVSPFSSVLACEGQIYRLNRSQPADQRIHQGWIGFGQPFDLCLSPPWCHMHCYPLAGTGGAASGSSSQTASPSAPGAELILVPARGIPLLLPSLPHPNLSHCPSCLSSHLVWFPLWSWARRTLMKCPG